MKQLQAQVGYVDTMASVVQNGRFSLLAEKMRLTAETVELAREFSEVI